MSLYQKYRPQEWNEVLGNEAEVTSLQKMIEGKNPPHVFLLSGPPGTGKTTLARISASKLGANDFQISEFNSANNRGIDTAREITESMGYLPMYGERKVYILDECASTSKEFQNAMLKPLEDTPEHVFFFLCTTDPGKLLPALKTRCTHINLSPIPDDLLYRLLRTVAKKEGKEIPKDILEEIADVSQGSPRSALVLLEKIFGMEDPKMMREAISIGEDVQVEVIALCRELLSEKASWGKVGEILTALKETDPEKIRMAVLGYMNAVLLKSNNRRAAITIECFIDPHFNAGRAGITLACFQSIFGNS